MTYKTAQMERVFEKLQIECKASTHHRSGFIVDDLGRKLFPPIFFSKGNSDIPSFAEAKIRKAMCLDHASFDSLLRCHLSRKEYLAIRLRDKR